MSIQDLSKSNISYVTNCPSEYTGRIIKLALACIQPKQQDLLKPLEKLASETKISKDQLYEILSSYTAIIRHFIHTDQRDFVSNMVEIGYPSEFVERLPFLNNKEELLHTFFAPYKAYFMNINIIKWRIDISLLNSTLLNKLAPNILISIQLKNGQSYTIELNHKAFHILRFNVALALKEMKNLSQNTALAKFINK
ncbi:uncharacterized protein LOC126749045 [Anthonomus grandis grandis]|uniref:uncharacterized protein LOC126749045 n=1 Tax=Anthonomus grandis grandis TaxID=2921223 RepID=UPI0021665F43|nr:uncharacterized protein LOC126749045 [Anthonomus grandis grandis]